MFENLRDAFSSAAKSLGERELKEKDIEDVLFQLEISLLESDVATEVIDSIKFDLKKKLIGTKVNKKEIEKLVIFQKLLQKELQVNPTLFYLWALTGQEKQLH